MSSSVLTDDVPQPGDVPSSSAAAEPHIRVLHVGPDPQGHGGMATVIGGLIASPLARRHRLEALATYRSADPLRRLAMFSCALVRLIAWCARGGARIVHVHTAVRGSMYRKAVCVAVAKAMRRPVLLHVHSGAAEIEVFRGRLGPATAWLVRRCIGMADQVVSVSSAGARALSEQFARSDVAVVTNAAPPVTQPRSTRGARDHRPVTVLYLGGFANPVKGGEVLAQALASLVPTAPSMRVLLAGPGQLTPAATALLSGDPTVTWLGWLDEPAKAAALDESDIFVLPSTSEGLPMALLEAMAHGLAIVATDMGGVPDVLSHGADALLVPPGDPDSLASAIRTLVDHPEKRGQLGDAARLRAEELGEDRVAARFDAIYRELMLR